MAVAPVMPITLTGTLDWLRAMLPSWPTSPLPQQRTAPLATMAQAWSEPEETAVTPLVMPVTLTGTFDPIGSLVGPTLNSVVLVLSVAKVFQAPPSHVASLSPPSSVWAASVS